MNCASAEDEIQKSLDGLLTPQERTRLDAHLDSCAACRDAWEAYRQLARAAVRWTQPLPQDDPGEAFTADVLAQIATRTVSKPSDRPYWLPLAATALLFALFAWLPGLLWPGLDTVGAAARQTPGWLLTNLHGVPRDTSAAWSVLTAGIPVPLWAWAVLPATIIVNGLFCLQARQANLRRSLP